MTAIAERTNAFVTLVFGYSVLALIYQNHAAFGVNAYETPGSHCNGQAINLIQFLWQSCPWSYPGILF
jgi:hypothetical protein